MVLTNAVFYDLKGTITLCLRVSIKTFRKNDSLHLKFFLKKRNPVREMQLAF